MAESSVHRSMKAIVRAELELERYAVVEEPLFPPGRKVSWTSYRPDFLGYRSERGTEELVLVECETKPSMMRFSSKNHSSVWFQPYLFSRGSVRRILAVPQGKLRTVDMRLRNKWEIGSLVRPVPCRRSGPQSRARTPHARGSRFGRLILTAELRRKTSPIRRTNAYILAEAIIK